MRWTNEKEGTGHRHEIKSVQDDLRKIRKKTIDIMKKIKSSRARQIKK